jgi:hypothetical protein
VRRRKASRRAIGKYTRVKAIDPRTGKSRLSYLYRTKSGKRRKIPTQAIKRSGHKTAAAIRRGRAKAATKVRKEGSAFVANKRKSARRGRAGRRLAAYAQAIRSGKSQKKATAAALRKVPLKKGDSFKGVARAPITIPKGRKRKVRVKRNRKRRVRRNRSSLKKRMMSVMRKGRERAARSSRIVVGAARCVECFGEEAFAQDDESSEAIAA